MTTPDLYDNLYFQLSGQYQKLADNIMKFREKVPENLKKEYDELFNIAAPTEKLAKLTKAEKYYLVNEEIDPDDVKEGDTIYFEMPPFCSGEYEAKVYKDEGGLYIKKEDNFFKGCRDFRINNKYWA